MRGLRHASDVYHPVLGFNGDAYETIDHIIKTMRGYGVTLTLENGSKVEAVLARPIYDEDSGRLLVEFYRVTDGHYPVLDSVPADQLERAFVARIQVH